MKRFTEILTFAAALLFLLRPGTQAHAQQPTQDRGYWRALSKTARATTGDISLSELKVTINFASFTVAQIHALDAKDTAAVFSDLDGTPAVGNLYRLDIPGGRQFQHHGTLCGAENTQYMVTAAEGRNLHVAFFSGASMPVLTPEAIGNATTLCGTYTYNR